MYQHLTTIAHVPPFVAGTAALLLETGYYFVHPHMMDAKLPLAPGVVVLLNNAVAVRTNDSANNRVPTQSPTCHPVDDRSGR